MGVWHFLPLGGSPGAVTSALAYVRRQYESNNVAFFGGDSNRAAVKKTSGIVIFTTPEVRHGEVPPRVLECVLNRFGREQGPTKRYGKGQGVPSAYDIVMDFMVEEFGEMLRAEKGKVYWLKASFDDLRFNLHQLFRAFYVLSPPTKTGRELWVNLTGGSNVMNLATMLAVTMSGITGRSYYTATKNIQLLRPASEEGFWVEVPVLKSTFDRDYEAILRVLEPHNWLASARLFNEVRQWRPQLPVDQEAFAATYLNKLDGWLIERDGDRNRLLRPKGAQVLELIDDPCVRALLYKEPLDEPPGLDDVFTTEREWGP